MHFAVSFLNRMLPCFQLGQDRIAHLLLTAHLVLPKLLVKQHFKEKDMLLEVDVNTLNTDCVIYNAYPKLHMANY